MDAKKLKLIVKGEKKPTFGTDPNEPWSVRAGINESQKGMLHDYLKSRGINPDFVSKDTKISHARSSEFHKWKQDHMFDDPINYVSTVAADKMKKIRAQREEVETEQLDEVSPETLTSYILKTSSKDPKRAEPRKKATSKLAKIMAKRPADPKAPRYLPMGEAKTIQGTALDKFRQAAAERARKHDDIERAMKARHAAGKEDMKGSIDRLEKQLNKEASDPGVSKSKETSFHKKLDKLVHSTFGKRKDEMKMKEEVEQIDELKQSTLASYKDKSDLHKRAEKFFKDKEKKPHYKQLKPIQHQSQLELKYKQKLNKEDVYQDSQAATQTAFDMGTTPNQTEPFSPAKAVKMTNDQKKQMSKSARMIKALYKKHKMVKEELYDHEKEDKSVATYGKKPKVEKQEVYDDDSQAAMVLKGGKTLTGQDRDTLEIDPVMRKANKNNSN